jgi:hypothetical protein
MKLLAVVFVACAAAVVYSQRRIDSELGPFRPQDEALYLWSGTQVRRMVPGFESIAADLYWLRTVQYFGGKRAFAADRRFELLRPLVEITTTLDPRMEIAYRYGAVFLSEPPPGGAGRPHDGIAMLERGAKALPNSWRLRQELGFFHFVFLKDARRASEILMEAAEIPGAAYWLKTLAADVLAKGGERESSRRIWQEMYERSEEGAIKQNARDHLAILDALDGADALTAMVAEFKRTVGRPPGSLDELRATGRLRQPPVDPAGVPYVYDPAAGNVKISTSSPLWRPER